MTIVACCYNAAALLAPGTWHCIVPLHDSADTGTSLLAKKLAVASFELREISDSA